MRLEAIVVNGLHWVGAITSVRSKKTSRQLID